MKVADTIHALGTTHFQQTLTNADVTAPSAFAAFSPAFSCL